LREKLDGCPRSRLGKGWLLSDTVPGAEASANQYSLVETAKANQVEPHAYLSHLFARLPNVKTVDDYEALLPWNVGKPLPSSPDRCDVRQNAVT
jgi:hypothetical protein